MHFDRGLWISILAATLCLPTAGAGQQRDAGAQSAQPAAPVSPVGPPELPAESQAAPATSDARSFLGAEEFTPGQAGRMRSYFLPSFQFSEMSDSNFSVGPGGQKFETTNTLVGRLTFGKMGKRSRLAADYQGGVQIYNRRSELNTTMHQFGISGSYQGPRWSVLLDDRASYLPESSFGYGGFGWMGSLGPSLSNAYGSNLGNLNPVFTSGASLYSGRGSRIMNAVATEVKYLIGPRSAMTVAGSYGLLHFREASLINSRNASFLFGYSRSLTARDYLGINYGYGQFRFPDLGLSFANHFARLSYGHRITGRMAMEIGGGPEVSVFTNPVLGSTAPVHFSALSSLNYRFPRGSVELSYSRHTSNGGGVLAGATTNEIRSAWSLRLTRHWSGSLSPAYAHNRSLPQTASGNVESTYDSVYANASLSRALGRYMTMFFLYNFQSQVSGSGPCAAGDCRTSLLRHMVGFGFDWHPRQIMVD
jgi:hypothetical protein